MLHLSPGPSFLQTMYTNENKHCNDDDYWQHDCRFTFGMYYLEAIRSRRHVQTQGYDINAITIFHGPKIHCVASQQVKNLSEKD